MPRGAKAVVRVKECGRAMQSEDEKRPLIDGYLQPTMERDGYDGHETAWMMETLRQSMGDAALRRGIRLPFDRCRYRTFTFDGARPIGASSRRYGT